MPVQYTGVMEEHRTVRCAAGLFDVSHMGEIKVAGPGAAAFVQGLTPNNVQRLKSGQIHYSALLTERGTYIDDLLVYRISEDELLLVVNASNVAKDFAWIDQHAHPDCSVEDVSDQWALLALQGPKAPGILARLTDTALGEIAYYNFAMGKVGERRALISRTGYTGEDGFELYVDPADAPALWDLLLEAGKDDGISPAGLGARDTLRLEAGMCLYGHEIDDSSTPWEASLGWTVKLKAGDFIGRDALVAQKAAGLERKLVGFEVTGKGIARQSHRVLIGGEDVGVVTSGTFSPTFEKALGMAYVPTDTEVGTEIELAVRKRRIPGRVVALPIYNRSS